MAKDIMKMKRERQAVVEQMRSLLTTKESRSSLSFEGDEETRYSELSQQVKRMSDDIQREEELQTLEAGTVGQREKSPNEIREFGDFLAEARFNPGNSGLQSRDVTMGNGPSAGFLVPEQFDQSIRQFEPNEAIFRPRATVIPAGSPPDAAMNLISLDQSGALGVYSGVRVQWIDENAARPDAGDPRVRQIKIEPKQVSGFIDISDKLLRNSAAAGAMVEKMLRGAILGAEQLAFWLGGGVGQPLGIVGHASTINIARAVANQIAYADIIGMYARAKMGGNYVWIASQTVLPQLMSMVDAGANLVWQPSAREGHPGTLFGIPVLINDQSSVLGQQGDLALVDLSYYAIKDGSPLAIFMDPYTQKVNGVTRMYAFWNVDGQPMITTPLLQRDGVSTVSPFVVLQ
jgi:HK97 family phage major capsid protein